MSYTAKLVQQKQAASNMAETVKIVMVRRSALHTALPTSPAYPSCISPLRPFVVGTANHLSSIYSLRPWKHCATDHFITFSRVQCQRRSGARGILEGLKEGCVRDERMHTGMEVALSGDSGVLRCDLYVMFGADLLATAPN